MGIASNFIRWFTRLYQPHTGTQVTGPVGPAETGLSITDDRVYQVAAAWACIKLLSEVVASLPLNLYQRESNGARSLAVDHPLFPILHDLPNQYQTAVEFRETMQLHLTSQGNTFARIVRNGVGNVTALLPLYASAMEVILEPSGRVVYQYRTEAGVDAIPAEEILHIKLFGPSPIVGLSPLAHARQSLGLTVAIQDSTSKLFKNGMRPGGTLESDSVMKPEQREAFRESLRKQMAGTDNAFKLLVLEAGFKYHAVTLSPEDAQMLEQWTFGIEEICRFFGVPPQLIGQTDKASSWASSLENLNLYFLQYTLRPYLTRWEQAINRKLLTSADRSQYFAEFNIDGLMRADFKSRTEGYAKALGGPGAQGYMTINEVRRKENLPDLPEGDDLVIAQAQPPVAPPSPIDEKSEPRVIVQPPALPQPPTHINVHVDGPQIEVRNERRGQVVREVTEWDSYGVPIKVIEREIVAGET